MPAHIRPLVKRSFGKLLTETPYNPAWVAAIKSVIPPSRRKYEGGNNWTFDIQYYACLLEIFQFFWGTAYTDAVGGVSEPQTAEWRERWLVWKEQVKQQADDDRKYREQERQAPPPRSRGAGTAYDTLYVVRGAPKEIITAAWRTLNAMLRKDDPDGTKNHEALARVNGAYQELKNAGVV